MPIERNSARPEGVRRTSFAVRSAQGAEVAAWTVTRGEPSTCSAASSGALCVDQQVVALLERSLVKRAARGREPAGRRYRHFGVVDEVVAMVAARGCADQRAVTLRRIGAASAGEIKRQRSPALERLRPMPAADASLGGAERKVSHARLPGKFAGILEPVVEPLQQQGVRVKRGVRAEVAVADTRSPGNVQPRSGRPGTAAPPRASTARESRRTCPSDTCRTSRSRVAPEP